MVNAPMGNAPMENDRLGEDRPAQTWMEAYEDVPSDFEARLDTAIAAHGLGDCTGFRHVERFVEIE